MAVSNSFKLQFFTSIGREPGRGKLSFCAEAIFAHSSKFERSLSLLANEITPGDAPGCSVSVLVFF
jgi:hypothetical protein